MTLLSELLKYIPDPIPQNLYKQETNKESSNALPMVSIDKRPMNKLGLHLGEHFAIVGKTGQGKTHMAKDLLEYLRRQYPFTKRYVLDSTEDGMDGVTGRLDIIGNKTPDLLRNSTHTQVWTPDTDVPDNYNSWFGKILYAREPAIVFVDEIASLTNGKSGDVPDNFIKLLKQGRKHDITVISLTQEISRVPLTMFRQMTHFILFRINNETYDLSRARTYLNVDKENQKHPVGKYGFFYRRTDGDYAPKEFMHAQHFFKDVMR